MTTPASEPSSPDEAPAEATVHAVLVGYDGEARCVSGARAAVVAAARADVAAGLASQTFWFGGDRFATTEKPARVVFGPGDLEPLTGGGDGPAIDDLGRVDPDSLGPPPVAPAGPPAAPAAAPAASPFDEFDDLG